MGGSYTVEQFRPYIEKHAPRIVVECGARDCQDTLDLLRTYAPETVYAFECNPEQLAICRQAVKDQPRIRLVESAVWDHDGELEFLATDMSASTNKNEGISSVFAYTHDAQVVQKSVIVPAIRLDTFMRGELLSKIDLLCMDIQGAELSALKGLGTRIRDVKMILLEIMRTQYYQKAPTYETVTAWLNSQGFKMHGYDGAPEAFINALFVRC